MRLRIGDFFLIAQKKGKKQKEPNQITAVAEVGNDAHIQATNRNELYDLVLEARRDALDEYLDRGSGTFGYVEFSRVFDVRHLGMAADDLFVTIGASVHKNWHQFVVNVSKDDEVYAKLRDLIKDSPCRLNPNGLNVD